MRAEIEAATEIGRRIREHYERGEEVTDEILDALGHPERARFYETLQRS